MALFSGLCGRRTDSFTEDSCSSSTGGYSRDLLFSDYDRTSRCRGRMITAGKVLGGTALAAVVVFSILGLLQAHGVNLKADWLSTAIDKAGQLGPKATFGTAIAVGAAVATVLVIRKYRQMQSQQYRSYADFFRRDQTDPVAGYPRYGLDDNDA